MGFSRFTTNVGGLASAGALVWPARAGWTLGLLLVLAAGVAVAVGLTQGMTLVPALLALALAACATLLLAYRHAVACLHEAVRSARDGDLSPLGLRGVLRRLIAALADDYDALARDFGSLFTEMERAQLAIIGERNGHEAVLQSLPGALLIVDAEHRITGSNLQAETLFCMDGQALMGQDIFLLTQIDAAGQTLLRDAFAGAQAVRNALLCINAGGDARHVSLNLTFFKRRKDATVPCAAVILQDVTEYKRLEEITHQTEKLVAMGQLAGGVAHELNTPLGTMMGYAQLLNEGKANAERKAEYARVILDEAKRCSRIIDNLLAYARQPACHPLHCDIAALVREARDAVSNCQGQRLQVPIEVDVAEPIAVRGGAGQVEIVLVNLLVNAVQACAGGAAPRVQIGCEHDGEFALVTVVDNGPGVPAENRRRIFDPFFTTKTGSGTGLGLAISHSITTRMGGTLHCDAAHSGGARFVLALPLAH
jgi:signal transduction histidine kinase